MKTEEFRFGDIVRYKHDLDIRLVIVEIQPHNGNAICCIEENPFQSEHGLHPILHGAEDLIRD